jgi:hypothetical protein
MKTLKRFCRHLEGDSLSNRKSENCVEQMFFKKKTNFILIHPSSETCDFIHDKQKICNATHTLPKLLNLIL